MKLVFLTLVAALLFAQCSFLSAAEDVLDTENEDAKLLVAKNILNTYIVEGTDVTIKYNIYNVGNL